MVELFSRDIRDDGRQSSKGNQLKWETDGIWYKADYMGYEGLSEYVVSELLKLSTLRDEEFVSYSTEQIHYKLNDYTGCKSPDYSGSWQTITLERLFKKLYGRSLNRDIYSIEDTEDRLKYLTEQVERVTGIKDFGVYVCKLFVVDALFLNEDRHTHNISVLMNSSGEYRLCPIYDNGAALLSDTQMDYPMGVDIYQLIKTVKAKTICDSFDDQLDAAEKMYGRQLSFSFGEKDVRKILAGTDICGEDIKERILQIILEQKRKYAYLFG